MNTPIRPSKKGQARSSSKKTPARKAYASLSEAASPGPGMVLESMEFAKVTGSMKLPINLSKWKNSEDQAKHITLLLCCLSDACPRDTKGGMQKGGLIYRFNYYCGKEMSDPKYLNSQAWNGHYGPGHIRSCAYQDSGLQVPRENGRMVDTMGVQLSFKCKLRECATLPYAGYRMV